MGYSDATEYDEKTLKELMKDIICDRLGVGPEKIEPYSHMIDDLGADSLGTVELTMMYEKEMDLEIPDEDVERIAGTFENGFAYLAKKLADEGRYTGKVPDMVEA